MEQDNYKSELPLLVMLMLPFIYALYVWNRLTLQVPIHFGINGQADGWAPKPYIFLMPALGVVLYLLLRYIRLIDPKKNNYESFAGAYYKIRMLLGTFFFVISLVTINAGVTGKILLGDKLIPCLVLLLLALLGNFMINIKPNWFIGIRTPWTLSNETVWRKTHLVGGRIWFYGGLVCLLLCFVLPEMWALGLMAAFTGISTTFVTLYSYFLFRAEEKKKPVNP